MRYLECVLVQCASLRLRNVDCDIVFVTNARRAGSALGRAGSRLLRAIEDYGVEIREAEYQRRSWARVPMFFASYYVFDAIEALGGDDRLWLLTDVDCVWIDAPTVFAAAAGAGEAVGSIQIGYPPDWDIIGYTPTSLGDLAGRLSGRPTRVEGWIGGELITATGLQLRALMQAVIGAEAEAASIGFPLNTEEQLLSLVYALGRVRFANLNAVAGRIWTGPRHGAVNPAHPLELGLWHLPGEKGLAFRRAARELLRGRDQPLRRELADPQTAGRRFNVTGLPRARRLRDDAWIAAQRAQAIFGSRRGS